MAILGVKTNLGNQQSKEVFHLPSSKSALISRHTYRSCVLSHLLASGAYYWCIGCKGNCSGSGHAQQSGTFSTHGCRSFEWLCGMGNGLFLVYCSRHSYRRQSHTGNYWSADSYSGNTANPLESAIHSLVILGCVRC